MAYCPHKCWPLFLLQSMCHSAWRWADLFATHCNIQTIVFPWVFQYPSLFETNVLSTQPPTLSCCYNFLHFILFFLYLNFYNLINKGDLLTPVPFHCPCSCIFLPYSRAMIHQPTALLHCWKSPVLVELNSQHTMSHVQTPEKLHMVS